MSFINSIGTAVFLMVVVFAVLLLLYGCIRAFSYAVNQFEQNQNKHKEG